MPSYNRVMLIGRLTRDPELRYTSGGLAVTKFSVAVDRRFKNQQGERVTDFFDCSAWRQTAEFVANYLSKGRLVAVDGRIEMNDVTGQDGQKRRYTNIVCDHVETLDSPRDSAGTDMADGAMAGSDAGAAMAGAHAEDTGYFPDEDPVLAPPRPQSQARPAQSRPAPGGTPAAAGTGGMGNPPMGARQTAGAGAAPAMAATGGNVGTGGNAGAGGNAARRAPAAPRQPEPAYPQDDYDDSDPFADE